MTKKLNERRLNVYNEAMEIAERASDENREFSPDEQGKWDALNDEMKKIDTRIQAALETEQRQKDTDAAFARLDNRPVEHGRALEKQGTSELRAWMRGEGGRFFDVQPTGPINVRALKVGALTDGQYVGTGGSTVPISFYDRLVQHLIENAAIMQAGVTVLNTSGGEVIQVPKTTAHSSASIVTEGGTVSTSEPTFGQVSLGAYKYGALIQISRELLEDTGVDLEGYLSMQAGRALGNAFGAHAITGTGSSQPTGVAHTATAGVTGGTAVTGAFTTDNLIDLFYSVIAPYRMSNACHWLLKDTTVGSVRKLKDSTGQFLWQPSMQVAAPDLLLGKPVLTDPNVAAVGTGAKSVLFGDFSQYFVRMAGGIRFERSDDFAFNTDLVTYRALMRADGALVDQTGAIKAFAGNAA